MKNLGLAVALCISICAIILNAQLADSATDSSGVVSTDLQSAITVNSTSGCTADVLVNVPAGRYVISVDVEYDMQAVNGGWISEQRSYLECSTTASKETSVDFWTLLRKVTQVHKVMARSGLTFANGRVPAGGLALSYMLLEPGAAAAVTLLSSWFPIAHLKLR
ncbi:MAG: hypothetical protein U5L96_04730 [Owenweeksia sp.]|nr:hypothetical protein [Owenweeksia sp.]